MLSARFLVLVSATDLKQPNSSTSLSAPGRVAPPRNRTFSFNWWDICFGMSLSVVRHAEQRGVAWHDVVEAEELAVKR
ncbi:MAG: hypothetical protein QOJ19_4164 [Acidimicrobiia bacterium]|jgi:hypothetical protein|nr:hypothetical protein [Acidimicrobiia bacterium]